MTAELPIPPAVVDALAALGVSDLLWESGHPTEADARAVAAPVVAADRRRTAETARQWAHAYRGNSGWCDALRSFAAWLDADADELDGGRS